MLLHLGPFITFRPSTEGHDFFRKKNSKIPPPQVKNVPSLSVRFGSITTIREITPRSSEQTVVCSLGGPRERRKSSLHNVRACYREKIKNLSFCL